jgi:hypothetical protein
LLQSELPSSSYTLLRIYQSLLRRAAQLSAGATSTTNEMKDEMEDDTQLQIQLEQITKYDETQVEDALNSGLNEIRSLGEEKKEKTKP